MRLGWQLSSLSPSQTLLIKIRKFKLLLLPICMWLCKLVSLFRQNNFLIQPHIIMIKREACIFCKRETFFAKQHTFFWHLVNVAGLTWGEFHPKTTWLTCKQTCNMLPLLPLLYIETDNLVSKQANWQYVTTSLSTHLHLQVKSLENLFLTSSGIMEV